MHPFVIPVLALGLRLVSASALSYSGADFSSLLLLESSAYVPIYAASASAAPRPFEQILRDFGVNLARIRIMTSGTYDLSYGLKLAKRAKTAGMDLLIALHYSDTFADPGRQAIPSGWPTDLEGLVSTVYNYTYGVMEAFKAQGTPIQFIQVGNEINDGLLWPIGKVSVNGFNGTSQILHAGALAVQHADPTTKKVLHSASGWDQGGTSWFLGRIFNSKTKEGLGGGLTLSDVDIIGLSFYPYYGTDATFSNLDYTMDYIVSTYTKPVMIVETGWPEKCDTLAIQLSESSIPVGVEGQITWYKEIATCLNSINSKYRDKALGYVYWEPGWTLNAGLGSGCSDALLVDTNGVARQSMSIFSAV